MDLQHILDRFKADLEVYIQAEVSRQLAAQMRNITSRAGRTAQPIATAPVSSEASIQASLDELAALAQTTPREGGDNAVDRLVSEYGGVSQARSSQVTATSTAVDNGNYLSDLAQLGQSDNRKADMSAYEALTSMNSQASNATLVPQLPQPVSATVTDTSNVESTAQLSGIQSFLQKIRQRKNLSSN